MAAPALLFVPLDDRPVTMDLVVDLARAAGVDVRAPDRALLGDRFRPGDVDGIWAWLDHQMDAGPAAALIASVEMLCLGGLVASRKSQATFEEVAPRLRRLRGAAGRIPTYTSAVIPRTPVQPTDEDAPYRLHRRRHLQMNTDLIAAAADGTLRYLMIGQDDTAPGSLSQIEREALQAHAGALGVSNVLLTSGADELNARLLARWLNDLTGDSPSVKVVYTFPWRADRVPRYEAAPLSQTVEEHVRSAGCRSMSGTGTAGDDAGIVLWVHNFEDGQQEARDQTGTLDAESVAPVLKAARASALEEQVVALADVRFANGADRALMDRLLAEPRFAGIVAYAGWNTCSNTLGSVISQAVVVHHMRTSTVPGNDRIYRAALLQRVLDDWGYQAVVRPQVARWLKERAGSETEPGEHEAGAEEVALEALRRDALPSIQASFRHHPLKLRGVTFPWHRLFEARVDLEVTGFSRPRPGGIAVVDYDPLWPRVYEEDKAVILRALGPRARGIEHVGSTSVPGLAAKPIIDIMLGVELDDLDGVIAPLSRIGYEYNPDWEISMPLRRYFRRITSGGTGTHHLHVVPYGGEFWTRHLRFRDYLRAHPDKAREYGDLKRQIARQHQGSIEYTFAKMEFIRSVEALAGVVHRR